MCPMIIILTSAGFWKYLQRGLKRGIYFDDPNKRFRFFFSCSSPLLFELLVLKLDSLDHCALIGGASGN